MKALLQKELSYSVHTLLHMICFACDMKDNISDHILKHLEEI